MGSARETKPKQDKKQERRLIDFSKNKDIWFLEKDIINNVSEKLPSEKKQMFIFPKIEKPVKRL